MGKSNSLCSVLIICLCFCLLTKITTAAETRAQIETTIKHLIRRNHILVFSKSYCPYCKRVKALFDSKAEQGISYNSLELDKQEQGDIYQDVLLEMTGQRTVPNVFIGQKHIGGHSDTFKLHEEQKLEKLLHKK